MRVLFVSPSAGLGGAERVLVEAARSLQALMPGWSFGLIATEEGPLVDAARSLGVDVMVLPLPTRFAATGEFGRQPLTTWLRLAGTGSGLVGYTRQLRRRLREWAPDIVHSNGLKTHILSAWALEPPHRLVWHVHDYLSTRTVSSTLLRVHSRKASLVLANSRSVAEDAAQSLGSPLPIRTVYNAVDTARFRPDGARLDLDLASGLPPAPPAATVRVGLTATFARWKGHDVFLRAVASLPSRLNIRAYVIGGPVYRTGDASQWTREEIESMARDLGLGGQIGFTGLLPDTAPALRALDVVVHASTRAEPFGLTIAEAMATRRAVISSDAGGAREIGVPEETCLVHAPGDVSALARQIERLASDPELRARLGTAAERSVRQRFTHRAMGEALRAAYLTVVPAVEGAA
jgi:glycosyltransferase involved in cell wall biosynthesis